MSQKTLLTLHVTDVILDDAQSRVKLTVLGKTYSAKCVSNSVSVVSDHFDLIWRSDFVYSYFDNPDIDA